MQVDDVHALFNKVNEIKKLVILGTSVVNINTYPNIKLTKVFESFTVF